MKPADYVAIVIRFLAIGLFLYGLTAVGATMQYLVYDDNFNVTQRIVFLLHVLIPFVIAIFVWFFPNLIARKIIRDDRLEVNSLNANEVLSILIAGIGVFTFLSAFIDGWYWIIFNTYLNSNVSHDFEVPLMPNHIADMWATGIEFALSIALILRCKAIAGFIIKISR